MFSSETGYHFATRSLPGGGVAPSRYALARHEYLERQRQHREVMAGKSKSPTLVAQVLGVIALVAGIAKRIGASRSKAHRVSW